LIDDLPIARVLQLRVVLVWRKRIMILSMDVNFNNAKGRAVNDSLGRTSGLKNAERYPWAVSQDDSNENTKADRRFRNVIVVTHLDLELVCDKVRERV
jgi:hypothetical protein